MAKIDRSVRQKYNPELGSVDTTNDKEYDDFGLPKPRKIVIPDSVIRHIESQKSDDLEYVSSLNVRQKSSFSRL